jgi:hypothetical protein
MVLLSSPIAHHRHRLSSFGLRLGRYVPHSLCLVLASSTSSSSFMASSMALPHPFCLVLAGRRPIASCWCCMGRWVTVLTSGHGWRGWQRSPRTINDEFVELGQLPDDVDDMEDDVVVLFHVCSSVVPVGDYFTKDPPNTSPSNWVNVFQI